MKCIDDIYWIASSGTTLVDVIRENSDGTIPWIRRLTDQQGVPQAHVLNNAGTTLWLVDEITSYVGLELLQMATVDGSTTRYQM